MLLHGKRLLVVGGGNGIGAETVRAYAEHGASVASFGINANAGQEVIDEAAKLGVDDGVFTYRRVDIREQEAVNEGIESVARELGGLDGITITAGVEQQIPAEDVTEADLGTVFAVNVYGTMYCAAAAFPYLRERGGSVITYASGAGVDGFPGMPTYSAAKGAVLAYTRSIAVEWGKHGIRANSICPAVVTPMMHEFLGEMDPAAREAMEKTFAANIPLGGKPGTTRDAADVNVTLSSDLSRFITSQTIPVDGGYTRVR